MKEKWIISYYGTSGDGYVDYENKPTNNLENCMEFDTEKECQEAIEKLQPEWSSKLVAEKIEEQMTAEEAGKALIENSLDWYIVKFTHAGFDLKHRTMLSSILECGKPKEEFDFEGMWQCWNGVDLRDGDKFPWEEEELC